MATDEEVRAALLQDPRFLDLQKTNKEQATQYAESAFVVAAERRATARKEQELEAAKTPTDKFIEGVREATLTEPRHVKEFTRQVREETGRTLARPILEAGGGALGVPYGPGGVVLGTAGGSALADQVEQYTGEQPRPKNIDQAVGGTLRNLETGTVASTIDKGLQLGGKIAAPIWNKVKAPFAAYLQRHPELVRIRGLAEAMGVPMTPGDITNNQLLKSFIEGIAERTPFSKSMMQNEQMKQLQALVNRRQVLLDKGGTPESISETGQLIQQRAKHLMDELGVTAEGTRRELTDSVLARLGSRESFEALGTDGQAAFRAFRTAETTRIGELHDTAMEHATPGTRVLPSNLNREVKGMEARSSNTNTKLMGVETDWLDQFRGSGNHAYDAQQRLIDEGLAKIPTRQWNKKTQQFDPINREAEIPRILGDAPREQPGWATQELLDLRKRLNGAIDQVDEGLKLTGRVGERGVGASQSNVTKGRLIKLKQALDADIQAYSRTQSPELQGALEVARLASGELKSLTNLKGVKRFLGASPQEAARMLAQSKDLQAIRHLRTVMGPEFRSVSRALSNDILGVGKQGTLTGASIRKELSKYEHGVVETMLGNGETRQMVRLAEQLETVDATAITNPLFKRILSTHPERVADLVVQPHNVVNIQEVRKTLGQGAVDDLKRGLVNKILQKPAIDVPDEVFMLAPEKILVALRRYGKETLDELFKDDPTFLQDIYNFAEVANAAKGASRLSQSRQRLQTGPALIAFGELTMAIADPKLGLKIILGIPAVTKLYLSKTGRKWLTDGFNVKAQTPEGKRIFGKIMGLIAADATTLPPVTPVDERQAFQSQAFQPQAPTVTQMALADTHPYGTPAGANPSRQGPY